MALKRLLASRVVGKDSAAVDCSCEADSASVVVVASVVVDVDDDDVVGVAAPVVVAVVDDDDDDGCGELEVAGSDFVATELEDGWPDVDG